jgi:hypothetical protein
LGASQKGLSFVSKYGKEDEMGMASRTNGGEKECIKDISGKAKKKETTKKTKT